MMQNFCHYSFVQEEDKQSFWLKWCYSYPFRKKETLLHFFAKSRRSRFPAGNRLL